MRNRYTQRTTADEIAEDFKTNAREALDAGTRYMGVARDWFLQRAEDMQQRLSEHRSQTRRGQPDVEEDLLAQAYRDAGRYARGDYRRPPQDTATGHEEDEVARGRRPASSAGTRPDWDREQGIPPAPKQGDGKHARQGHAVHAYGYRGMGPRDYQRTDARIAEDINERLYDSDAVDARDIAVQVNQGIVLMTGTVPHRWMKHLAEDLAERCRGVADVENQVRVHHQSPEEHAAFSGARSTVSTHASVDGSTASSSAPGNASAGQTDAGAPKRATHVHEPGDTIGTGSRAATPPGGGTPH
ncbi:MAG: BON domain-containing protein [Pseudoxanthomonas sp.]